MSSNVKEYTYIYVYTHVHVCMCVMYNCVTVRGLPAGIWLETGWNLHVMQKGRNEKK